MTYIYAFLTVLTEISHPIYAFVFPHNIYGLKEYDLLLPSIFLTSAIHGYAVQGQLPLTIGVVFLISLISKHDNTSCIKYLQHIVLSFIYIGYLIA